MPIVQHAINLHGPEIDWVKITYFYSIQIKNSKYIFFMSVNMCMCMYNSPVVVASSVEHNPHEIPPVSSLFSALFFSLDTTQLTPHVLCTGESTEVS